MAGRSPVTEGMLPIIIIARTAHRGRWCDHPIRESRQGRYTVRVRAGHTIRPANLVVGRKRPSAQNQLLQP